jgi:hypothetical protein
MKRRVITLLVIVLIAVLLALLFFFWQSGNIKVSHSCLDHTQIVHLAWVLSVELRPLKLLGDPIDPTGRRVGLRPTHMSVSTLHAAKSGGS